MHPNGEGFDQTNGTAPRVLVIDDDPDISQFIADAADIAGYICEVSTTAEQFKQALKSEPALIVMDLVMPETDGIELLRYLGDRGCKATIVLMSGFDKRVLRVAEDLANEHGLHVAARLQKPFRLTELLTLFDQCANLHTGIEVRRSGRKIVITASDLERALVNDEFVLHYQPQMDVTTDQVIGIETLVRWQHPDHGLVFPDAFIGIAESLDMIERLTWLIIRRAFSERRLYSERYPGLSLSINVSAHSLNDLMLPDTVFGLAETYGMPPSKLILEITESGLIKNLSRSLDVLTRLRVKQMRMSIDDFGTGYSMLQQLRRVPATELKIDKSFVKDMHADDGARALVNKTIELGHELDMVVVAEGVETESQLATLRERGCDVVQGYLFSRPLPLNQLTAWMDARQA